LALNALQGGGSLSELRLYLVVREKRFSNDVLSYTG